jgi:hypothetical protein
MAAVYLGGRTVGGTLVGLTASFDAVGDALAALSVAASAAVTAIATAQAAIDAQAALVGVAKAAIRVPAVAELEVKIGGVDASILALNAQISDPTAFLAQLAIGLGQVSANLAAFGSLPSLNVNLSGQLALKLALEAKVGVIDVELQALTTIAAAITAQVAALASVASALSAAISATAAAAVSFASLSASLAVGGAQLFLYTGPLSDLGAAFDAVSASAGIGSAVDVRVPIVVVQQGDAPAVSALNAVYSTS